jgi:quercetin dioxygenase-like cupin family protein
MKICRFEEAESFQTPEGLMTPLFAYDNVAITHLKVPAGLQVKPHSHPGDGILILTAGSVKLLGREITDLKAGDLAFIPGETELGLESHEDSEAIILSVPSRYSNVEEFRERLRSIFSGQKEQA